LAFLKARLMAALPEKRLTRKISPLQVAAHIFFYLLVFIPADVWSRPLTGTEYEVKTGFIYNFANFVSWPPAVFKSDDAELVLCLASDMPAADALFKLNTQTIRGRKIKVISYSQESDLDVSHILYIATQNADLVQKLLGMARGRSILTIGEIEGFSKMGGIINFFQERNRLRFKVNIDAANRAGLTMSSQLLGSAQIFREEKN
jgi:hypothetical protein